MGEARLQPRLAPIAGCRRVGYGSAKDRKKVGVHHELRPFFREGLQKRRQGSLVDTLGDIARSGTVEVFALDRSAGGRDHHGDGARMNSLDRAGSRQLGIWMNPGSLAVVATKEFTTRVRVGPSI